MSVNSTNNESKGGWGGLFNKVSEIASDINKNVINDKVENEDTKKKETSVITNETKPPSNGGWGGLLSKVGEIASDINKN